MSVRDAELIAAAKQLNHTISDFQSTVDIWNRKFGTPQNTSEKIIGYATYRLSWQGSFKLNATGLTGPIKSLCYVGDNTWLGIDGSTYKQIYKLYDNAPPTLFADIATGIRNIIPLRNHPDYYAIVIIGDEDYQFYDSDGVLLKTLDFGISDAYTAAIYDYDNEEFYMTSWDSGDWIYTLDLTRVDDTPFMTRTDSSLTQYAKCPYLKYGRQFATASYLGNSIAFIAGAYNYDATAPDWFLYDFDRKNLIYYGYYNDMPGWTTPTFPTIQAFFASYNYDKDYFSFCSGDVTGSKIDVWQYGLTRAELRNSVGHTIQGAIAVDDYDDSLTIDGTLVVSSSALPTGAATSANQDTQITSLELIDDLYNALKSINIDQVVVEQRAVTEMQSTRTTGIITDVLVEIIFGINEKYVVVQNTGDEPFYYGYFDVTSVNGIEVLPHQKFVLTHIRPTGTHYMICAAGKNTTYSLTGVA